MNKDKFTPLSPDQVEAVAEWLKEQFAKGVVSLEDFERDFSTPPAQEYVPGRWFYGANAQSTWIARFSHIFEGAGGKQNMMFGCSECYTNDAHDIPLEAYNLTMPNFYLGYCKGPATPEQILSHLSLAAEKKGFKPGVRIKLNNPLINTIPDTHEHPSYKGLRYYEEVNHKKDVLAYNDLIIYEAGQWAEIVQEEKAEATTPEHEFNEAVEKGNTVYGLPPYLYAEIKTKEMFIRKHMGENTFELIHWDRLTDRERDDIIKMNTPNPLPEKWCVKITAYILNKHCGLKEPNLQGHYYYSEMVDRSNFHGEILEGYPLITEEQFKYHVMQERTHTVPEEEIEAGRKMYQDEITKATEACRDEIYKLNLKHLEDLNDLRKSFDKLLAQPPHDQWEYMVLTVLENMALEELTSRGNSGWEAWSICPKQMYDGAFLSGGCLIHFKRRKQ